MTSNSYRGGTESTVCGGENGQYCTWYQMPVDTIINNNFRAAPMFGGKKHLEIEWGHFNCRETWEYLTEGVRKNAFHAAIVGDLNG